VRLGSGHWSYDKTPADPQCSSVRCRRETWTRTLYSSSSWCCWSSVAGDTFTDVAPNPLSGARLQLDFSTGSQRFLRGRRVDSIPSRGPAVSLAIHAANSVSAASSESVRAAARTLDGTQSGNGTSLVTWRPELVWTSRTCERRPDGSRPAARTRAGHNRRWTNVTLPLRSRHTRTSSLARIARVTAKIS
jgi:hypothetical protein